MEDDKLKDIFRNFQPELSSDNKFLDRLQKNMEVLEIVKRDASAARRRNVISLAVAALSGFVAGVIVTLLFPLISSRITETSFSIPLPGITEIMLNQQITGWILAAILSTFIAFNAYELTNAHLSISRKEKL